jgi:hypothetical protein
VVVVLAAQVPEMAFKVLRLFLALSAQSAAVSDAETMELVAMVVLVAVLQMALLEARQHLGRVMLAALAQVQAAV